MRAVFPMPLLRDRRGNSIVEFGLAMPILCLLLIGMLDLGKFGLQKMSLLHGAREGAQYGILAYSESTNINSTAVAATGLSGVTGSNNVFCECVSGTTVSCGTTCAGGATLKRYITVTTTKSFSSVLGTSSLNFGTLGSFTPPSSISASITMIVP
jgi:Flp pilus assembly protein TadG